MSDHVQPSPERDAAALQLMRFFFVKMVEEEQPAREDIVRYLPEYFVAWLREHISGYDRFEVLEQTGIDELGWDYLQEVCHSPVGTLMIAPVWPHVVLHDRPGLKHRVCLMTTALIVHWDDGTIMPYTISLPADLIEGGELNDALAASQIDASIRAMRKSVIEDGLDKLHDRDGRNFGGEHPFDVLLGTLLQILPQLKPELHEYIRLYLRACQMLMRPPMPPEIQARIEAGRQKRLAAQETGIGGWDG